MSALKPEHNACVDCVASLACMTMERPFQGQRFAGHLITECTQCWCPDCCKPTVIKSMNHFESKRLEWTVAPRAKRRNNSYICEQCKELKEWNQQLQNYQFEVRHREDMTYNKGGRGYVIGVDMGNTSSRGMYALAAMDTSTACGNGNVQQYLVTGDIANSVAEQETPIEDLKNNLKKATLKVRLMKKQQKARRRENVDLYWGGKKP